MAKKPNKNRPKKARETKIYLNQPDICFDVFR